MARFILVLSFVHLVLNHSSAYTVFCLHGCFSKVSKNSVSRGPPVLFNFLSANTKMYRKGSIFHSFVHENIKKTLKRSILLGDFFSCSPDYPNIEIHVGSLAHQLTVRLHCGSISGHFFAHTSVAVGEKS